MASNRELLRQRRAADNAKRIENTENHVEQLNESIIDREIQTYEKTQETISSVSEKDIIHRSKEYNRFHDFPNIKLKLPLLKGEQRELLKASIQQIGVQTPAKVIKVSDYKASDLPTSYAPDDYIILGGHNRKEICQELDIDYPYTILQGLNQKTIEKIVAEDHILNRQLKDLTPSEKVHLFKALNEDGKSFAEKFEGQKESRATIYRLLSLQKLSDEFVSWVDGENGHKLPLFAAISIASLSEKEQSNLIAFLSSKNINAITINQAERLKSMKDTKGDNSKEILLTDVQFEEVFLKETKKEVPKPVQNTTVLSNEILEIIPKHDRKRAEDIIKIALKMYYKNKF